MLYLCSRLLAVTVFTRVGVMPILIDIEPPANESAFWNDEFERGKVLLFASTRGQAPLKPSYLCRVKADP
jgi:hypothetical protein